MKPPRQSMIMSAFKQDISRTQNPVRGARGFSRDISSIDNTVSSNGKPISISSTTDCQCVQAAEETKKPKQDNKKGKSNKIGLNTSKSPPTPAPRTTLTRGKQNSQQVPSADELCIEKGLSKVCQKESSLTGSRRSPRSSKPISRHSVGLLLQTSRKKMTGLSKVCQKESSLTGSRRSARSSKPISRRSVGVLLLNSRKKVTGLSKVCQKESSLTGSRRSARSSKPIGRRSVGLLLLTSEKDYF